LIFVVAMKLLIQMKSLNVFQKPAAQIGKLVR